MSAPAEMATALVSVVIPCFNQAHFLAEAIESVLQQSWPFLEVIVVDDGSTDDTRIVAATFNKVKYIYQENQGVSRARNAGIKNSKGQYLIFLDADDWLYPEAIVNNFQYLLKNPDLAFVSGAYDFVDANRQLINETYNPIAGDHYIKLLEGNYIGSPAAVMYQRWVFNDKSFDFTVDACADYDLYLQITRDHPVVHQTNKVAAYRKHNFNMSSNIGFMLSTALKVLQRQRGQLRSEAEKEAFKRGVCNWKRYYSKQIFIKLLKMKSLDDIKRNVDKKEINIFLQNFPFF